MATAALTVIALGRADASASRYIAEIQRRLERQDRVRYVLHAMGTSLEGSTEDILAVVAGIVAWLLGRSRGRSGDVQAGQIAVGWFVLAVLIVAVVEALD